MDYREFIQLDLPVAVAIVSCGADWRVEEANAEFTDVLGYTEKELRETRPQKMVYDEDYANLVSVLENVVRTHDNGKMQLRIVRPDGKTRWVEMRCSVLAHYDVKPYVVLFLWDIDEEKRREEHQKLLNQKYELMEQLSLEYPFDLDVENWTMLRSYRLMELRGQYDYSEQYFPVDEEVLTLCPPDQELFLKAMKEAATEEKTGSMDISIRKMRHRNISGLELITRALQTIMDGSPGLSEEVLILMKIRIFRKKCGEIR